MNKSVLAAEDGIRYMGIDAENVQNHKPERNDE
jgi:hypothetical protein